MCVCPILTLSSSSYLLQELVERVKEYGGRFLVKGTDELWYEMTDERARLKASQCKFDHTMLCCSIVLIQLA